MEQNWNGNTLEPGTKVDNGNMLKFLFGWLLVNYGVKNSVNGTLSLTRNEMPSTTRMTLHTKEASYITLPHFLT